jgi:tripartite-type tricarboxylate transporter receptor subunit TctC
VPYPLLLILLSALLAAPALAATAGKAETSRSFPLRSVRLVVPYPPGGATDIMARIVSAKISDIWGQSVVIDNRPGGGGLIGAEMAAKAAPDGYTLYIGTISSLSTNVSMYKNLPYDPVRDFAPVTQLSASPYVLVTNPSVPVKTVKELLALAKARPGTLNYGSAGPGGGVHLSMELFKSMTGADIVHVPYKGTGPSLVELIAGQTQVTMAGFLSIAPHLKSGKVRGIAVSSLKRASTLPALPTIAESGLDGYEANSWNGVLAPARASAALVKQLHADFVSALRSPELQARVTGEGAEIVGNTPAEFGAYIKSEIRKWAKVVQESGAKIN